MFLLRSFFLVNLTKKGWCGLYFGLDSTENLKNPALIVFFSSFFLTTFFPSKNEIPLGFSNVKIFNQNSGLLAVVLFAPCRKLNKSFRNRGTYFLWPRDVSLMRNFSLTSGLDTIICSHLKQINLCSVSEISGLLWCFLVWQYVRTHLELNKTQY